MHLADPGDPSKLELIAMIPLAVVAAPVVTAGVVVAGTVCGINEIIQQSRRLFHHYLGKQLERVDNDDLLFPHYRVLE